MVCGPLYVFVSWALQILRAGGLQATLKDCLLENEEQCFLGHNPHKTS